MDQSDLGPHRVEGCQVLAQDDGGTSDRELVAGPVEPGLPEDHVPEPAVGPGSARQDRLAGRPRLCSPGDSMSPTKADLPPRRDGVEPLEKALPGLSDPGHVELVAEAPDRRTIGSMSEGV